MNKVKNSVTSILVALVLGLQDWTVLTVQGAISWYAALILTVASAFEADWPWWAALLLGIGTKVLITAILYGTFYVQEEK